MRFSLIHIMGVDLRDLLHPVEVGFNDLKGKTLSVDAYNIIYQFLTTIRQRDGSPLKDSKGRVTSHFSGLFYRSIKLMSKGIRLCYVFDGPPPVFKQETLKKRKSVRSKAREEYEKALEEKDFKRARKMSKRSTRLEEGMVEECKELLNLMGVPCIQAPSEGEAQAAFMCNNGDVDACVSQDYDSLLFKTPVLVRNLSITGRRKVPGKNKYYSVNPEKIVLSRELDELGVEFDDLITMGILIGTDYNPKGVYGVGPKTALKLVKKCDGFDEVFDKVEWEFGIKPREIFNFFKKPPVLRDYALEWSEPDEVGLRRLLCEEHGFSEKRVGNALKRFQKFKGRMNQTGLRNFM